MQEERKAIAVDLDGMIEVCANGIDRCARLVLEATGTDPQPHQIATVAAVIAAATAERLAWHAIRDGAETKEDAERLAHAVNRARDAEQLRCMAEARAVRQQQKEAATGN